MLYFSWKTTRNWTSGVMKMPWYMKPTNTCKVLHRIARRHSYLSLQELNITMDRVTQMLWNKQRTYQSINQMENSFGSIIIWGFTKCQLKLWNVSGQFYSILAGWCGLFSWLPNICWTLMSLPASFYPITCVPSCLVWYWNMAWFSMRE